MEDRDSRDHDNGVVLGYIFVSMTFRGMESVGNGKLGKLRRDTAQALESSGFNLKLKLSRGIYPSTRWAQATERDTPSSLARGPLKSGNNGRGRRKLQL